jgi:hypothetical protein
MLAFGWLLVPGAVQAAADVPSDLPSSVLYYEPPPPGAPPAPPVPNVPTVIGVGNVPGVGYKAHPLKLGATDAALSTTSDTPFSPGTDCRSAPTSAFSYGVVYRDGLTVGNPNHVYADPLASNITVSNLDTADPSDHAGLGIIGWVVRNAPMFQNEQVSMGYWRGDIERNSRRYWNDILEPHQVMIYMEYSTLDGQGNEQYNWVPLLPVDQATRHQFLIRQDDSGHFYNFYLDGELKWANVYMLRTPDRALMQNEDQNTDGVCDGGYTDVNWMEPAMDQLTVYDGHAVNEFWGPPWRTFNAALETMLPFLGYPEGCGVKYPNGYFWRCGDYNVPPDE